MRAFLLAAVLLTPTTTFAQVAEPDGEPMWSKWPDKAQWSAHWPKRANGNSQPGRVMVTCTLTTAGSLEACSVDSETPDDAGFGKAALALIPYFKAPPKTTGGQVVASRVRFPLYSEGLDKEPDWTRRPNVDQLRAAWPGEAARRGVEGRAVLDCEVSSEGGLRKCSVANETPEGMGFGAAALTLTPAFRFKPGMRDGQPVASRVGIPINFKISGGSGPIDGRKIATIPKPTWAAAPTRAELHAAYPTKALSLGLSGAVSMECRARADGTLGRCDVLTEEPRGKGFGTAARGLSERFRLAPLPPGSTESLEEARVRVPVQFNPPAAGAGDTGGARLVLNPNWRSLPTADRIESTFPAAARAAGVREGRAMVSCEVQPGGQLGTCSVVSEQPEKLGFGAAALLISTGFALAPWTEDGKPVDGAIIRVPIRYVDGDAAAPSIAP